jgi:hypothetical protein
MTITTTPAPGTPAVHALDATAAWLSARVPDRFDSNLPLLVFANPSTLAAAASEYARRLIAEFERVRPGKGNTLTEREHATFVADSFRGRDGLRDKLLRLPKALLEFNVDARELESLRAGIDQLVDEFRNPTAQPPHAPEWIELARDLDVELDQHPERAREQLLDAIQARRTGDRRYEPLFRRFVQQVVHGCVVSRESCILRRAIGEAGFPPMRKGSLFETMFKERELREPAPQFTSRTGDVAAGTRTPAWFWRFLKQLGEDQPAATRTLRDIDDEYQRRLTALRHKHEAEEAAAAETEKRDRFGGAMRRKREEKAAAELKELAKWPQRERDAIRDNLATRVERQRYRVIDAFDRLAARLPLGAAYWWSVEVRRVLALDSDAERPLLTNDLGGGLVGDPGHELPGPIVVWRFFNLKLELAS